MKAIETALTELSANLRRMEQRHQAVGYNFGRLYDLIAAAREELAGLTADAARWRHVLHHRVCLSPVNQRTDAEIEHAIDRAIVILAIVDDKS